MIEVPYENPLSGSKSDNIHLWTVVRVLQHMSPVNVVKRDDKLNLSSEESMSAGSAGEDETWHDDEEDERDAMTTSATIEFTGLQL